MNCQYCGNTAVYKCSNCGMLICEGHTRQRIVCFSCLSKNKTKHVVKKALSKKEQDEIRELVTQFWGEEEQLVFDRKFNVSKQPALVARVGMKLAGFVSLAEDQDSLIVVALGIRPEFQGSGIGRSLIKKAESEARRLHKKKVLVSTSNDNLPALGFYQSLGFQIFEVRPNGIAEKHGGVLAGVGGLPVRDELRLRKVLE